MPTEFKPHWQPSSSRAFRCASCLRVLREGYVSDEGNWPVLHPSADRFERGSRARSWRIRVLEALRSWSSASPRSVYRWVPRLIDSRSAGLVYSILLSFPLATHDKEPVLFIHRFLGLEAGNANYHLIQQAVDH